MSTILVIDDNPAVATALEVLFSLHDIASLHADSPAAGLGTRAHWAPIEVEHAGPRS